MRSQRPLGTGRGLCESFFNFITGRNRYSALFLLTIGMVNDMYVESRNDGCLEAYMELATQVDFDYLSP